MSRDIIYEFPRQWHAAAQDNPTVEVHIGPAGTGKTFNAVRKLLLTSMQQPAIGGVRKAIVLMVRNTYENLIRSTLKTAEEALLGMDAVSTVGNRPATKVTIPLPDGTRLEFVIEYLAVDRAQSVRALLEGRMFTHAILDEAPTSPRSVLSGLITRLGRYPTQSDGGAHNPTIICTANGGYEDNWLCDIAEGRSAALFDELSRRTGRMACGVYWDPPGLIPPEDQRDFANVAKWRENPEAVNIDNLPGGYDYYWNMLANVEDDPAFVRMYVVGGFIPRITGELVFPEFAVSRHVIEKDAFSLSPGATIGLSFDFGRRPVCLFWTRTGHGRMVVFDEFMMKNSSISDLMAQKVWPAYHERYGSPVITWATGDPAGLQGGQGYGTSPYEILQAMPYDLPMEPPGLKPGEALIAPAGTKRIKARRMTSIRT